MRGLRIALGIVAGIALMAAVVWFSGDIATMLGGDRRRLSVLTNLAMVLFGIVTATQLGTLVATGSWAEDRTWPKERSFWLIGGSALVFALSIMVEPR